jgi:Tfp pilus tip-associated adhesin PilY1
MRSIFLSMAACLVAAALPAPAPAAVMEDYCVIPSYVRTGANPNIMILMDNDENNAGPAYTKENTGDVDTLTSRNSYNASREYFGIFRSKVWYSYSSNKFYPDINGIFDGNMLNWALTSGYDMIESILVGGKASARVGEKVKSLKGESSGTWENKIYLYTGTDGASYACEVAVANGNAVFKENSYHGETLGKKCGLIINNNGNARYPADSPLVRPASASAFEKVAALLPGSPASTMYAANGVRAGVGEGASPRMAVDEFEVMYASSGSVAADGGSFLAKGMDLVNSIVGRFTEVAVAAPPCTSKPVSITNPGTSFDRATAGVAYSFTMTATGGDGNYTWSLAGKPAWLTLNASTGQLSGTPGTGDVGTVSISATVTDTCSTVNTKTKTATLETVLPGCVAVDDPDTPEVETTTISILTPSGTAFVNGTVGAPYVYTMSATGGDGNFTWTLYNTPAWLVYNSTSGQLTGTPNASGTDAVTIKVEDTCITKNTTYKDASLESVLSTAALVINSPSVDNEYITQGVQGSIYNGYIAVASGGQTPYAWSASNLSATGLDIDSATGLISGVPTAAAGTYGFTLTVADLYSQTANRPANVKIINTTAAAGGTLSITSTTTPSSYIHLPVFNRFYSGYSDYAKGGTPPYTWSATNLPSGLSINSSTGLINGTPTGTVIPPTCYVNATYSVWNSVTLMYDTWYGYYCYAAITVTDSLGATSSNTRYYYLNYTTPEWGFSWPYLWDSGSFPTLSLTQAAPFNGWTPIAYGGYYSYVWSATGLPSGLSIDSSSGLITGTPTGICSGTCSFQVCVKDALNRSSCGTVYYTISATVAISGPGDWGGYQGEPIVPIQFAATGGVGPYTWSATQASGAALPGSLSIDATTGYFSGAPPIEATSPKTYSIKISVKDKYNNEATYTFTLTTTTPDWTGLASWELSIISCPAVDPDGPANSDGAGGYYNDPYTYNCSNFPPDSVLESSNPVRSGLIQEYVEKARFGLMDFASDGEVTGNESCVYQYSKDKPSELSSFFTQVENAVPTAATTMLENGVYKGVNYFLFNTTDPGKNDFYDPTGAYARKSSCASPYDVPCRKNFVLVLTGGAGAEQGTMVFDTTANLDAEHKCRTIASPFNDKDMVVNACVGANTDVNLVDDGTQRVMTYAVNVSKQAATYFSDGQPTAAGILNAASKTYGGGKYYAVDDPADLRQQLGNAFDDMIKRAASGTAASVLASGEGSGANLIQAVYYPGKEFYNPTTDTDDTVFWLGRLSNFWYYVDPFFLASSIREDTNADGNLNLDSDYVVNLYYDPGDERVEATRSQDTNADGTADLSIDVVTFEEVGALWEAGTLLWENPASDRTFYVHFSNTTTALTTVNTGNAATVAADSEVQRLLQTADTTEATDILKYTLGEDITGYRSRTVYLDADGDGTYEGPHVWKLGDVVDSTPRILSHLQINKYDTVYEDYTYSQFVNEPSYQSRGYVFAGGNDGMLHAFTLGQLDTFDPPVGTQVATLTGADKGREAWAFIPRNALPYLTYVAEESYCHVFSIDLSPYLLDASVGSSGVGADCTQNEYWKCERKMESWRTILIGGMRTGGGCRASCPAGNDCVQTPLADAGYSSYFALDITDPAAPVLLWEFDAQGLLGATTSGPTILKVGYKPDGDTDGDGKVNGLDGDGGIYNGRWFAVFGSGPTGPIDTDQKQFLGKSDQTPKLFVLDLYSGALLETLSPLTAIGDGFIGSIIDTSNDSDQDYQDDAFYVGYTYEDTSFSPSTFTKGGVGRILTWEDMDPANWTWTTLIDDIGSVTSSIVHLQNNSEDKLWLYWGSGRFFYKNASGIDDATTVQALYGVKDPCYVSESQAIPFVEDCDDTYKLDASTDLEDKTTICTLTPPDNGWFINLEGDEENVDVYLEDGTVATYDFGAERVITDPLASTIGVVYFTSFRPYSDQCDIGGRSYVWAVDYESGGDASARLKGTALIQVSTGAIEQLDLTSVFGDGACDGTASDTFGVSAGTPTLGADGQPIGTGDPRKSASVEGVPPVAQGFSLLSQPAPTPRVLHQRER